MILKAKKRKIYFLEINISLRAGLSNFPDATNGRFIGENSIMTGILKAASLVAKKLCNSSLFKLESFFK